MKYFPIAHTLQLLDCFLFIIGTVKNKEWTREAVDRILWYEETQRTPEKNSPLPDNFWNAIQGIQVITPPDKKTGQFTVRPAWFALAQTIAKEGRSYRFKHARPLCCVEDRP